jgi:hypothetical protein
MIFESVTIGKNIKKVCANAFKGAANLKTIFIDDLTVKANSANEYRVLAKSKGFIKLGKNSLKGTSKELVISVSSKAEKKALRKQLKKAGNKKAKVLVR